MKRLWVAFALLLFITVICVSGLIMLNSRTNQIIAQLEDISTSVETETHEVMVQKAAHVQETWNQWRGWYTVYLQHSIVDPVTEIINRIPPLVDENNLIECQDECIDAILKLKIILESEQLSLGNIL